MYIFRIKKIDNYRNLTGLNFKFNPELNFIVGENNLGKTNIIELINSVITRSRFYGTDFLNPKVPIQVIFTIKYDDNEIGFFENHFDIEEENEITIRASQESVDDRIEYYHDENDLAINQKQIKALNFIYYSSLRSPSNEINFSRNKGTGKVLNYIMKKSLDKLEIDSIDIVDKIQIKKVIDDVNETLVKINGIPNESILAYLSSDNENIINKLLDIGDDSNMPLGNLGDGVQYSFNIFLNILELLVNIKTYNTEDIFNLRLIEENNGKRYLPIILSLDEIEIHQHPYRQRAIIKSIQKILNNENSEFISILKDLFDVDGLKGQLIAVTHSPNIILNDFHQIIRLYKQKKVQDLKVVCGENLKFGVKVEKHLMNSFIYYKEAMFSKSVILVEGATEFGAIPEFVKKLGCDLDEQSIGLIKLDGADSVLRQMELFREFGIDTIVFLDRDKYEDYKDIKNIYFTDGIDFEEDIYNSFTLNNLINYLVEIERSKLLIPYLKKIYPDFDGKEYCKNPKDYKIDSIHNEELLINIKDKVIEEIKNRKNVINGSLLGSYVDNIPRSFESALLDVLGRVKND